MKIIDSHLHLPVRKHLLSLENQKDELISELKRNSIDRGIVIPDNVGKSAIGNLKQCIQLFEDLPNIYILGTVNILEDDLEEMLFELNKYFSSNKIVGLKIFPGHDKHYPNDKRLYPFFELCVKYNRPLVIHTGENSGDSECSKYNDPKYIIQVSKQFPKLQIIISHLFWPKVEYCVDITKDYNNISYDTSALADEDVIAKTGGKKIEKSLEDLIQKYYKRVLYGSDYGMCSIKNHIDLVNRLNISDIQREEVFYKNSIALFGL
ncbi:MAG: amidohydrolase family protein [Novosphingobium sp.]|nr:amidohydrolase family protein [Novosphingobium sp.]